MKYKVIGWGWYDDPDFEEGVITEAACDAIIADIAEHGYLFTGHDHQYESTCSPILSDGKRYTFSARAFGGLMARAHGHTQDGAYARYAFDFCSEERKFPETRMYKSEADRICASLSDSFAEEFTVPEGMEYTLEGNKIKLPDEECFSYIAPGDTLVAGGKKYLVTDLSRYKVMTKEQLELFRRELLKSSAAVRARMDADSEDDEGDEDIFSEREKKTADAYITKKLNEKSSEVLELELAEI